MKEDSTYKHIFKYTGVFGGVQGLTILIGLVRYKIISELLGPSGIGLISVFNTSSSLVESSTNFGLQMSGVREISLAYNSGDNEKLLHSIQLLRSWIVMAALLGIAVCVVFCNVFSHWAFSSNEHMYDFMLLAPVVGLATITGGETAILKATRHLKELATASVIGVIVSLIISIPLYIKWLYAAIVPSLVIVAVVQMIIVLFYSYKFYPFSFSWNKRIFQEGSSMIKLGTAFVIAGIMANGADFAIRAYLCDISESLAGLFNAGYMITMTYAGMVFAAMETDYYPRLSAVSNNTQKVNETVNKQIAVSCIMVAPLLVLLMVSLKIALPILFSSRFMPVIGMTQIAVLAMYFRAVNLPIAYIMLAKGDSKAFMISEAFYNILIVFAVIFGYNNFGLDGTGAALAIVCFIECVGIASFCIWKYDFKIAEDILSFVAKQFLLGICTFIIVRYTHGFIYWLLGSIVSGISILLSYRKFKQ